MLVALRTTLIKKKNVSRPDKCINNVFISAVLGVDWVSKVNATKKTIPKYDHIQRKGIFDEETHVELPMSLFKSTSKCF